MQPMVLVYWPTNFLPELMGPPKKSISWGLGGSVQKKKCSFNWEPCKYRVFFHWQVWWFQWFYSQKSAFNFIQLCLTVFLRFVVFLCLNPKSFQPSCQAFPNPVPPASRRIDRRAWLGRDPASGSYMWRMHHDQKEAWQIQYSTYFDVSNSSLIIYIYIFYIYIHYTYIHTYELYIYIIIWYLITPFMIMADLQSHIDVLWVFFHAAAGSWST